MSADRRVPPRFVTRTLVATLATVAFVVTAVLLVVTFMVRDHVRRSVVQKLETGQRLLATLEDRRAGDLRAQVAMVAENPTLKAALDTYEAERRTAPAAVRAQLVATVAREIEKLAARLDPDVLAARDARDEVIAVAGRRAADWTRSSGVFRATTVPVLIQDARVGSIQVAHALDARYALELSAWFWA